MGVTTPTHQTTSVASPCLHNSTTTTTTTMTRTHKGNDRDHVGLANGTAVPEEHLPRRRPLGPEDQIRSRRRGRHRVRRSPARPPRRGLGRQPPREDEYLVLGGYYGQY